MKGVVLLVVLLGSLGPAAAGAADSPVAPLSLSEYRARLAEIAADLRTDPGAARAAAGRLLGERIAFGAERLAPDSSVLGPLARGVRGTELRRAAVRLSLLVAHLGPGSGESPSRRGDPQLLARLAARQALPALPRGGALLGIHNAGPLRAFADFVEPLRRWVADLFWKLWDGLARAFTHRSRAGRSGVDLARLVTVLVIALAAVLAVLGLLALRRRGAPVVALSPAAAPSPPPRDDDPLSRRAGEWEAYAAELAAAGRFREAIRAWYHAVLVALYQGGILYHRKGRTNWEYVAAVPPEAAWRPAFVAVTRRFEREWYGGDRSSRDALDAAREEARGLLGVLAQRREEPER